MDLLAEIQQRLIDAEIARHRAELAAVTSPELAWLVYLPTPHDDPADWKPYLTRLTDLT